MMDELDEDLRRSFETFSIERWADTLRTGIGQYAISKQRGEHPRDFSGFGLAESLLFGTPLARGLRELYDSLGPGKAQSRVRASVREILADLRPPPNQETCLIGPILLNFCREARVSKAMGDFAQRARSQPAWRSDRALYHAALQLAFGLETHPDAAELIRTVVGPAGERSPHFELDQMVPCVRALICSEGRQLERHFQFFLPDLQSADPALLESVAAEFLQLRDEARVRPKAWEAFALTLPDWLIPYFEAVADKGGRISLSKLKLAIDSAWGEAFGSASQAPGADWHEVGLQIGSALEAKSGQVAAQWSLLQHVFDRWEQHHGHASFPAWLTQACQSFVPDILQHVDLLLGTQAHGDLPGEAALRRLETQLNLGGRRGARRITAVSAPSADADDEPTIAQALDLQHHAMRTPKTGEPSPEAGS